MSTSDILVLESKVKEIYARDKSDPELYTAIYNLAEKILVLKRIVKTSSEVHELAHNLASDFYIRLNHEDWTVVCWTKYIQLTLLTYRSKYYDETSKCQFTVDDVNKLDEFTNTMYSSSKFTMSKYSTLEIENYIESLPDFIYKHYDKVVRYTKHTKEYSDHLMSVLCSIMNDRIITVGKTADRLYVEFLVKVLMKRLNNYMNRVCETRKKEVEMYDVISAYKSFDLNGF